MLEVNGTLIWYCQICEREVWLMYHNIVPDQKDENIDFGRFLHEQTYQRQDKEISFGNIKFDVIFKNKDKLVIGETKKSSKYEAASVYQLAYYLSVLKESGIEAQGQLLYPEEKKRVDVILDKEMEQKLEKTKERVTEIIMGHKPPKVNKIPFCKHCGYREYCYA